MNTEDGRIATINNGKITSDYKNVPLEIGVAPLKLLTLFAYCHFFILFILLNETQQDPYLFGIQRLTVCVAECIFSPIWNLFELSPGIIAYTAYSTLLTLLK